MRAPTRRDVGLIFGWTLAMATAALVAWGFAVTPILAPFGSVTQFLLLLRVVFVVLLVLVLTGLLYSRMSRAQRGDEESRLLLNLARGPLLLADAGGTVRYVNRPEEELFGYPTREVVGRPLADLFAPESAGPMRERIARQPPGERSAPFDLLGRRKDGVPVPLQATIQNATVRGESVSAINLRDVTERDELVRALAGRAAELARSNRDLEQFAYVASHDLQEPLRMVGSYTELLRQRYKGKVLDADGEEFLQYAQEGATRMRELIDNLLAYSRLESRGKPFEPVSMEKVVDTAVRNLRRPIEAAGAQVTYGPMPDLDGDASQLVQLFQNLIENALKFHGPSPPQIRVTTERRGPEWVFSVQDNGIGIPPEHRERVFVIFQRLHTREEYPGSGIGLSTCKKVVERHGGKIWVESTGKVGEGTAFRFSLPVDRRAPAQRATPAAPLEAHAERAEEARTMIEERLAELI